MTFYKLKAILASTFMLALFIYSANSLKAQTKVTQVEACVFKPELVLPKSLEPQREELTFILLRAQKRLLKVAKKYEWSHLMRKPLMEKAEIFDSKLAYDKALRSLYPEAKEMKIPKTFTAGFKDNFFFAVSPEVYKENVPQYVEADFYEKLITHELAHRLHMKLVNGDENKMGPMWFWEGFATIVSGQFEEDSTVISKKSMLAILEQPKRGSYKKYNQVMKHFLKLVPLPEMVRRATKDNFKTWLLENANP